MSQRNILVADDDAGIRMVVSQALVRAGHAVRATGTAAVLWRWASQGEGDLVVTDVYMPDGNAFEIIPRLRRLRPELPVIVMSAESTLATAVTVAELGAFDYLAKPFDLRALLASVARALAGPAAPSPAAAPPAGREDGPLIGRSPAMQEIYRSLARLTQTDLTVMLTGESGTGKELVARALHAYSRRRHGPFVAVDMTAIPEAQIEAELFGTGKAGRSGGSPAGRLSEAAGGTLFLDGIGDMPLAAQTRLLRVLQESEHARPSGGASGRLDARLIAASRLDLGQHVAQGLFREDLFYRLNVVPLRLPPLRQRLDDIPDLVRHFLAAAARQGLPERSLEPAAIDRLRLHAWPGNVRELENLVRRLCALHPREVITSDIVEQELAAAGPPGRGGGDGGGPSLGEAVESRLARELAGWPGSPPEPRLHARLLREVELPVLRAVLTATAGNQLRAAEILGLNRNTLRKRMRELEITVQQQVE